MNTFRRFLPGVALALALASALPARAQTPAVAGEVTKVDRGSNRITLRHGEIKHLDMPPMTMVFRVRDPKLLEGVNPGDKVRFVAEKVEGNYTVLSIQK